MHKISDIVANVPYKILWNAAVTDIFGVRLWLQKRIWHLAIKKEEKKNKNKEEEKMKKMEKAKAETIYLFTVLCFM